MHLSQPQRAAERMAKAVRPGGWLCLEESDYSATRAADSSHPLASHFTRRMRVAFEALRTGGIMDPYFGVASADWSKRWTSSRWDMRE